MRANWRDGSHTGPSPRDTISLEASWQTPIAPCIDNVPRLGRAAYRCGAPIQGKETERGSSTHGINVVL